MPSTNEGKDRMDPCGDMQDAILSVIKLCDYLSPEETSEIHQQFKSITWKPDKQVLWSGMVREKAQEWADKHGLQTLTTAMGLLLRPNSPRRSEKTRPDHGWARYIHGASAMFAWHIAKGAKVTVLSPPPPQRFHPSMLSYFQVIELPILVDAIAQGACLQIEIVHPGVTGAENYPYQFWPIDEAERWIALFRTAPHRECKWRMVKGKVPVTPAEHALTRMRQERSVSKVTGTETSVIEPTALKDDDGPSADAGTAALPISHMPKAGLVSPNQISKEFVEGKIQQLCGARVLAPTMNGLIASRTRSKTKAAAMRMNMETLSSADGRRLLKTSEARVMVTKIPSSNPARAEGTSHGKLSSTAKTPMRVSKKDNKKAKKEKKRARKERNRAKSERKREREKAKKAEDESRKQQCAAMTPRGKENSEVGVEFSVHRKEARLVVEDAFVAMELQYQLEFPWSQRAGLPHAHLVMESEQMELNPSSADLQARNYDDRKMLPQGPSKPLKAAEFSDTYDLEKRRMDKSALRKARKEQRAAKERQLAPAQRAANTAKRVQQAAKKAVRKAASKDRKAALRLEKKEFKEQRGELQKLVGVTLLESFSFLVPINTY